MAAADAPRLVVYDDRVFDGPSARQVEQVLRALPADQPAILEIRESHWVQTVRFSTSYLLEYHDGSDDDQFERPDGATLDEVVDVFLSFLAGTDAWRTRVPWRHLELAEAEPDRPAPEPARRWPRWARVVRAVLLVGGAFITGACCGRDEYGWIIGPIAALVVAGVLVLLAYQDRRDVADNR